MPTEYRADFLWPYEEGSIEEAGYAFANSFTEASRRQWWDVLIARVRGEPDPESPILIEEIIALRLEDDDRDEKEK